VSPMIIIGIRREEEGGEERDPKHEKKNTRKVNSPLKEETLSRKGHDEMQQRYRGKGRRAIIKMSTLR